MNGGLVRLLLLLSTSFATRDKAYKHFTVVNYRLMSEVELAHAEHLTVAHYFVTLQALLKNIRLD